MIQDTIELLRVRTGCSELSDGQLAAYAFETIVNRDFMHLYMSSVETYISLAIAALGLSAAFREKVLARSGPFRFTPTLILAWTALFLASVSGASYLYAAPKHIQQRFECSYFVPWGISPGEIYGACVVFLIVGFLLLFVAMIRQVKSAP